jgi:hypothetical protein
MASNLRRDAVGSEGGEDIMVTVAALDAALKRERGLKRDLAATQRALQEQRMDFNSRAFQLQAALDAATKKLSVRRGSAAALDALDGLRPHADSLLGGASSAAEAFSDMQRAVNEMGTALAAAEVQV